MQKKLRFGVLGVSNHFVKRIILPVSKLENCEIYAIASRDIKKAQEAASEFSIPVAVGSYEELIAHPEVDAIYNPLPNHLHAEWTIKALEAGKPVLCEKPLAMDAAEAEKMAMVSEKTGVPLMEAFMYRFHPIWRHAKDMIKYNQLGAVTHIHAIFSYNNPDPANIRNVAEYGGGGLLDIGCYTNSVPRFLTGMEPRRVVSLMEFDSNNGTDINASGVVDYGSFQATFNVSTRSEPFQRVQVLCTGGSIVIYIPFNIYYDVPAVMTISTGQGTRDISFPLADSYGIMFSEFTDAVINKKPMPIPVSDAIANMKLLDALARSAKSHGWEDVK